MVAEAHRSALLCIKIGFRFFDSSLVANKEKTKKNRENEHGTPVPNYIDVYGCQSSHENLNQFSAQRIEKHSFNFNSKLLKTKPPAQEKRQSLRHNHTPHPTHWPLRRVWINLFSRNYVGKNEALSYVYATAGIYRIPISMSRFSALGRWECVCGRWMQAETCKNVIYSMKTNIDKHL